MAEGQDVSVDQQGGSPVGRAQIEVDGCRIHYLKSGSGAPVLLLHGGASDSRDWLGTIDVLSESHTLYAPDMIGYGRSDRSKDVYGLADFVEFALGFMEALDLGRAVLVGHSLGGRVCMEVAMRHSDRVQKLVLVDTAGFSELAFWGNLLGALTWNLRRVLRLSKPYPTFQKENGGYGDWVCLEDLPAIEVPTLIVWSRFDPYYALGGARKAVRLLPQARLETLPCCGHAPHVKRRNTFNNLLREFLDQQ